ncbi:hypothetical protein AB0D27_40710 [Streptomyces sp. NPDC048415]|jgi:hypothetical protein|uniref:hypothetical protein n=1 Tax=Streptomyces sp. NPDC048415 TaxID=3154822 RepID=UPI003422C06C
MKRRVLIAAAVSGFVASATLGGSGTASASADAAPPGYSGPFLGECKGHWVKTVPVPDGMGEIKIWYDPAGSGTYCAKTYDNRAGDHNMEVRLRHQEWAASWHDTGVYSTYAGGIYVSQADDWCAFVSGWVEVNGTTHYRPETLVCET